MGERWALLELGPETPIDLIVDGEEETAQRKKKTFCNFVIVTGK